MKHILLLTFTAMLILSAFLFPACKDAGEPAEQGTTDNTVMTMDAGEPANQGETGPDAISETPSANPQPPIEFIQTFTLRINENMPLYEYTAVIFIDEYGKEHVKQIDIVDEGSGVSIQTITLPRYNDYHEVFTKYAVYFADVTFDGNLDILVPHHDSARYLAFSAFIWDDESMQFTYTPSFENIFNPTIDNENKRIIAYSYMSGGWTGTYFIFLYGNNEFIATNSFTWEMKMVQTHSGIHWEMYCCEMRGDTIVNEFYPLLPSMHDWPAKDDPLIKPYYAPGSFWDLDHPKWRGSFTDELKRLQ